MPVNITSTTVVCIVYLFANVNFIKYAYKLFMHLFSSVSYRESVTTKINFSTNFRCAFIALNLIRIPSREKYLHVHSFHRTSVLILHICEEVIRMTADPGDRAVYGVGLQPLDCWHRSFESR